MTGVRRWFVVALLVAVALGVAGCGSDDNGGGGKASSDTTKASSSDLTASFRGVTADAIDVGIVYVDYDCIKDFIDFNRGDQQAIAESIVDDINAKGGVGGRKLAITYKKYCPINNAQALEVCTSLTEDSKVFAVLGVFIDFSGDAQLCLSRDHETVHIGHELRKEWIDEAPAAMLLTPDITAERRVETLTTILGKEGTLDGATVAVLGDQDTKGPIEDTVEPALKDIGLKLGSTAILSISGPNDNPAALAQLDSFIEKWKGEKVTAVLLSGQRVEAKDYVNKIKGAMPAVQLLADQPSGVEAAAKDAVTAKQNPNPYEGILSTDGQTQVERWKDKSPMLQHCVDVWEKASGTKVIGPDELKKGPDGKRPETHIAVQDFCTELNMFAEIAEKAGPNVTNASWAKAVDSFGHIDLPTDRFASLKKGKYDAQDGFRLISFSSTIGSTGDWKPLTEIVDTTKKS